MKDRIKQIMDREGMTPARFADEIGVNRASISHITSGRNNPSLDIYAKILERFTYVDSDWLLSGKGTMVKNEVPKEPDLFGNTAIFATNDTGYDKKRQEMTSNPSQIPHEQIAIEAIKLPQTPSREIDKIIIFYSDHTVETFVKEKKEKD